MYQGPERIWPDVAALRRRTTGRALLDCTAVRDCCIRDGTLAPSRARGERDGATVVSRPLDRVRPRCDRARMTITLTPVGVVRSSRTAAIDDEWDAVHSRIELDPARFGPEALAGLDSFSAVGRGVRAARGPAAAGLDDGADAALLGLSGVRACIGDTDLRRAGAQL